MNYTLEYYYDKDGGVVTFSNEFLRVFLAKLALELPDDIALFIYEECLIHMPESKIDGAHLSPELLEGKRLIVLSEGLNLRQDLLRLILTHEIAHVYLNHESPIYLTEEDGDAQEKEADKLAAKWLKMNTEEFRAAIEKEN